MGVSSDGGEIKLYGDGGGSCLTTACRHLITNIDISKL